MYLKYVLDFKLLLEYLKVFISFPFVIGLVLLVALVFYKEDIRELIKRLRGFEAVGTKAAFDALPVTTATVEAAVKVAMTPKREEVGALPEGEDKQQKIADLRQEEDNLRQRITEAVGLVSIKELLSSPSSESKDDLGLAYAALQLQYLRTKQACKDLIIQWIADNEVRAFSKGDGSPVVMTRKAKFSIDDLYKGCLKREPQLVNNYSEESFKSILNKIIRDFTPVTIHTGPIPATLSRKA